MSASSFDRLWHAGTELSPEATASLAGPVAPGQSLTERRLHRRLTAREREVLTHVVQGSTAKEIASRLSLSPRTVERHIANTYTKIGARGRADAIAFGVRMGLAD
jgi:DNA-binding NarL/FixJ family response regulator